MPQATQVWLLEGALPWGGGAEQGKMQPRPSCSGFRAASLTEPGLGCQGCPQPEWVG